LSALPKYPASATDPAALDVLAPWGGTGSDAARHVLQTLLMTPWTLASDGHSLRCPMEAAALLGATEPPATLEAWLRLLKPDDAARLDTAIQRCLRQGAPSKRKCSSPTLRPAGDGCGSSARRCGRAMARRRCSWAPCRT